MKRLLQKGVAIAALAILGVSVATAQTWQWGKRGGGPFDGTNIQPHEKIVDIATDKNGNVYMLGVLSASGAPTIDGHVLTTFGEKDIIVSSFSCNGAYRWSKVIGGAITDAPGSIGADTLGHVYVTGRAINNGGIHFDADTVIPVSNKKTIFLVQYDTTGAFKWLRQPGGDTASEVTHMSNSSLDMIVSGNGDVYWYAMLMPGLVSGGNGWVVPARNGYLLKYNAAGIMTGHVEPQMDISGTVFSIFRMNRIPGGTFIFTGSPDLAAGSTVTINGQTIPNRSFITAFSPTGQYLWKRGNANYGGITSRPAIDKEGHIYISGCANPGDTLNNYAFVNTLFPAVQRTLAFIGKWDSAGNNIWTRNASAASSSALENNVVLKGNNEVWLTGIGSSVWWDSTHKIQSPINSGYPTYVARFTTQGTILSMDSLKGSFGAQIWGQASASDRNGNLYIGGEFDNSVSVNGQTLSSVGGASDFFIAKLGSANCSCTIAPVAFNKTIAGRTVTLTYNSSLAGIDSVIWNYGNGVITKKTGPAMSTAFTYTYPANGSYNICATAYGSCGADQSCQSITVAGLNIGNAFPEGIKIYPNPANDHLVIDGAVTGTTGMLLNLLGQEIARIVITEKPQSLSLKTIPAGTYLLVLSSPDGLRATIKILRQ